MRGLTVSPRHADSLALTNELAVPQRARGELLVQSLLVGICGTDREIVAGRLGSAPEGEERLVLGHESLGKVLAADDDSKFRVGELVTAIVRRPDAVPCACCAAGEWDMCSNGEYTERGISGAHGFASELFALDASFAVYAPPELAERAVLLEPASVVAKAWEQVDRIGARSAALAPRRALITGAGPIGLLAALLAVQRGYDVTVLDTATEGPKPDLVRGIGATYASGAISALSLRPDIVIECSGNEQLLVDVLGISARNAIVCLTAPAGQDRQIGLPVSQFSQRLVLGNQVVFGTVNANRRHFAQAASALLRADARWLDKLVARRVPLSRYAEAFELRTNDVKVVLDMQS